MGNKATPDYEVQQGIPEKEQLVRLLQRCFDGPRSHEHIEWKYDRFPEFNDEHVFYISDASGAVVALRRLFYKQLRIDGKQIDAFVGGDSCVVPSHRDQGLFSKLLSRSTEFEQSVGRDISISFNKQETRTFGSKIRRNWTYQPLPLFVRVFTPERVLPRYAKLALQRDHVHSLIETKPLATLYRYLPEMVVAALVEAASTDRSLSAMRHFRNGKASAQSGRITSVTTSPHEETIAELRGFYQDRAGSYPAQFRRDRRDITHMLSHPCLEDVICVYDDTGIAGVAVLIARPMDSITEGRVLDVVAKNSHIHQQLIQVVETAARNADIDILSMVSQRAPVENWARVDQQVMMWKTHTDLPSIDLQSMLIGHYDVV